VDSFLKYPSLKEDCKEVRSHCVMEGKMSNYVCDIFNPQNVRERNDIIMSSLSFLLG